MLTEQQDVFYYITLMNENYIHPAMPEGAQEGILKGMYPLTNGSGNGRGPRVQLLGSGTILREAIAAADLLKNDFGVAADLWSVPSFTELRRDGIEVERWNMLHPTAPKRRSHVETCLADRPGPVVAATDYIRTFADQIRPYVPHRYRVLGTDGFGRSDYRKRLRSFFEIDRHYITVAALRALADEEQIPASRVDAAIKKYEIDPEKPNPATV
jgi:pyruvate dehydrogenase E1 component